MTTKTYLKRNHAGYYVELPEEIDAEYWEGKTGTTYEDFLDNKWVLLSVKQVKFHKDNPTANVKEVLDMQLTPAPERTLEQAKQEKIMQIEDYDRSEAVNNFTLGNQTMWLTVEERQQIATQISANEAVGRETMTRYFEGQAFTFTLTVWKQMLVAVEVYAGDALNVTESHKTAVNALDTIAAVDAYDYQTGYPERLVFTI